MKHFSALFILLALSYILPFKIFSQKNNKSSIPYKIVFHEPLPAEYTFFKLKDLIDKARLEEAPFRWESDRSNTYLEFPVDKNSYEKFNLFRTRYMEADLARKYPAIKTYVGKSKNGKTLYLSITPYEITGIVLRPGKNTFLVKQYDATRWIGFDRTKQEFPQEEFVCETDAIPSQNDKRPYSQRASSSPILRKYRYAISTTGEYTQYQLNRLGIPATETEANKKAAVVGALITAITRMNSVYERESAISLELVSNNDAVIFLDANTDPFDNSTTSMNSLLSANKTTLNNHIGESNYDVGQVWCQGGLQGLAMLNSVCNNSTKAMGAVRGNHPETDRFIVSVASHELGHQFGASHVFYNNCGGNRSDNHAVETGSGTTIMAYAGICPPNIQNYTDDRFNFISLRDFQSSFITTGSCSQNIDLVNHEPQVNAGPDKYIPKETPFVLSAMGADPDGDHLTYTWDEEDLPNHNHSSTPQANWITGPMFRPYPARTENYRYFPKLEDILQATTANPSTAWEVLPAVQRILKFNVTVRDNNTEAGLTHNDEIFLGVDTTAGPFKFTSQTSDEVWQHGQNVNITWDVAQTDQGNISCSHVHLIMAPDGAHFTDTLAAHIPNTGAYTFTVPNGLNTPQGRLMLKADDNYFFTVALGKIRVGNYTVACHNNFNANPSKTIPDNTPSGISDTISIATNEYISDVNVYVDISHNYIADLVISLISPAGNEVVLWDRNCGNQDNLNFVFDDQGNQIDCSNLSGNLRPVNSLSVFNSQYTQGDWVLKVSDHSSPDGGVLNAWGLDFCYLQQGVEKTNFQNIQIYPVPADENIHIKFHNQASQAVVTQIFDLNGRLLLKKTFHPNERNVNLILKVDTFSAGNYILQINQGKYFYNGIISIY